LLPVSECGQSLLACRCGATFAVCFLPLALLPCLVSPVVSTRLRQCQQLPDGSSGLVRICGRHRLSELTAELLLHPLAITPGDTQQQRILLRPGSRSLAPPHE
jgi:hypothetical protein